MLRIEKQFHNPYAEYFCEQFIHSSRPKYILGRNEFAESIANCVEVDGFIDEFTNEKEYLGKPIVGLDYIPDDALVVSAVTIGKPLIAEKKLKQYQFYSLDYFAFYKFSGLNIEKIFFWNGFSEDFKSNLDPYEKIYNRLSDKISKNQFSNIINFRLSYDINFMRGFSAIEDKQYFEDFLMLNTDGESFADVGAFDGYTTQEFIRRCPGYRAAYLFEPDEKNIITAKDKLAGYKNITYYKCGLSDKREILKFSTEGSSSKISNDGTVEILVDRLDGILDGPVSFIKMDIEGAEGAAINGSSETIKKNHPKLAISAYHKSDDLWKIPAQVLSIRDDYKIFLRHYTEGIAETVIFFVPVK